MNTVLHTKFRFRRNGEGVSIPLGKQIAADIKAVPDGEYTVRIETDGRRSRLTAEWENPKAED